MQCIEAYEYAFIPCLEGYKIITSNEWFGYSEKRRRMLTCVE